MTLKKKKINFLVLSLAFTVIFFLLSYFLAKFDNSNKSYSQITSELNFKLKFKEKQASIFLNELVENYKKGKEENYFKNKQFLDLAKNNDIIIFIYNNDSLIFWNDNSVDIPGNLIKSIKQENLLRLGNGWYDCQKKVIGNYSLIALVLIKHEYEFQNNYLNNDFNKYFDLSLDIKISNEKGKYNIYSNTGNFLLSLHFNEYNNGYNRYSSIINICNILGIIFLFVLLLLINTLLFKNRNIFLIASFFMLVLLRIISIFYKIPHSFYISEIFSPLYYANSVIIPSLGDLLIDSIILLILFILFYKIQATNLRGQTVTGNRQKTKLYIFSLLAIMLIFLYNHGFIYIFRSLIINSNIIFSFNNIFNLSLFSYIGYFIVSIFIICNFLLLLLLIRSVLVRLTIKEYIALLILVSIIAYPLLGNVINILLPIVLITLIWFAEVRSFKLNVQSSKVLVQSSIVFLLVISAFLTFLLNRYNEIKEHETRKLLAVKLAEERDPTVEYLFGDIKDKINTDKSLFFAIENWQSELNEQKSATLENDIKNYIQKKYFTGYWSKYNIQITICESKDSLLLKPENINTNCRDFFLNMIEQTCKPVGDWQLDLGSRQIANTGMLFYRYGESVNNSYIAYFTVHSPQSTAHSQFLSHNDSQTTNGEIDIFIEIDSKFIPKELGYPQLLIDKKLDITSDYSNYAYSKYKNDELIYQYGKYFYRSSRNKSDLSGHVKEFSFVYKNRYNHLIYNADKSTAYIISKENDSLIKKISPFSYLIIFFGVLFLILNLIINPSVNLNITKLSLQSRIQYSIIFIVIISFVGIGSLSVWYINRTNNEKNTDNLSEKTHSILIEIENKLSDREKITPLMNDYISGILVNLSNVFFTDINLFNEQGRLISSSRPKIFDENLLSQNMNPIAASKMLYDDKTLFMQKENIGELSFYSSYMPVRNIHNKTIAYLNLPYFAKQSEYKNEISAFLTTFINTYIIIVALSILVVLLISNYITYPLKLIREKISRVKLGKINEKIEWKRNDELGRLINEYNNMIDELGRSAELLGKSERESAWREMAKQVAHEIKNPLTPMKLSVQHLLKISSGFEVQNSELKISDHETQNTEQINRVCRTLIEQIDLLSDIATGFSDFARMPVEFNEKVNLIKVINNTVELYKNADNVKINFKLVHSPQASDSGQLSGLFVYADYKQLLRAFNNLIKNSIQALENRNDGIIDIEIIQKETDYIVRITDNGYGISEEDTGKIFSPNFTTKSGGSGLGLSLVKSIIDSAGGKVWFESQYKKGTVFYILLPVFKEA